MFMNVCMLAMMVIVPSHSVPLTGAPCLVSGYTKAWNELLHPAAIAKNDTRFGLHEGGAKHGLSKEETEWIPRVTGHVICPGAQNLKGEQGSGALVGRSDLIVTSAHLVRNNDGSKREDWPSCYFETQSQPPIRRKLKFFDSGTIFGTRKPNEDRALDYVLIRLEDSIPGVEPIPIAPDPGSLTKNQRLLVISAYPGSMPKTRKVLPNEPIIQVCYARDMIPSDGQTGSIASTDCSSIGGYSGSIILSRDESNHLVGVGMQPRGSERVLDGKPYDPTFNTGNHSFGLLFDGSFGKDLQSSLGVQSGL